MRVTQSMLSNTMLRNLNTSYSKLAKLQEQISTGSKLLRPSDNPVGVAKAMSYRTQLTQNEQYEENLDTATKWLDSTDTALGSMSSAMQRVQELVTQAANDTNQTVDRAQMLKEIEQIYEEIKDLGNTKIGDTYIFSGARTNEPLYGENVKEDQVLYRDANGNVVADVKTSTQKDGTTSTIVRDAEGNIASTITTAKDANGNTITTITDGDNNVILAPATGKYIDHVGNIIETAQDGTLNVSHAKDASNISSKDYFTTRTTTTTTYSSGKEVRVENADGTSVTSILDNNSKLVAKISITKDSAGNPITTVTDGSGALITQPTLSVNGTEAIEVYADGTRKFGTLNNATFVSSSPISTYLDNNSATVASIVESGNTKEVRDKSGSLVASIVTQKDDFNNDVVTVKDKNGNPIEEPNKVLLASDGAGNTIEVNALGNVKVQYFELNPPGTTVPEGTKNVSVSEMTFKDASGNVVGTSETVFEDDNTTYTTTVRDHAGNLISTTTGPTPVVIRDNQNMVVNGLSVKSSDAIITTDATTGLTTVKTSKDNISTTNKIVTNGTEITSTTTYTNSANNVIATTEKKTNAAGESITTVKNSDGNIVSTTEIKKDSAGRDVITVKDSTGNVIVAPDKLSVVDANGNYIITDPATGLSSISTTTSAIEGPKTSLNTAGDNRLQTLPGMNSSVNVEIYNDIQLEVNTTGAQTLFNKLDTVFEKVFAALKGTNGITSGEQIGSLLGGTNSIEDQNFTSIQGVLDLISMERSTVGAKQNRVDMMADRLALQKETLTKQQSNVEDVEYEEAITNLITQESIHNASLSVGGKIIQQTLVNFL